MAAWRRGIGVVLVLAVALAGCERFEGTAPFVGQVAETLSTVTATAPLRTIAPAETPTPIRTVAPTLLATATATP